jgi:hypothetical protein
MPDPDPIGDRTEHTAVASLSLSLSLLSCLIVSRLCSPSHPSPPPPSPCPDRPFLRSEKPLGADQRADEDDDDERPVRKIQFYSSLLTTAAYSTKFLLHPSFPPCYVHRLPEKITNQGTCPQT